MNLPEKFLDDMKIILKDEFDDFIKSYEDKKTSGIRINTLKIDKETFLNLNLCKLTQISWCDEGFYYDESFKAGKNPLHEAGAYYIQEPSAMSVVPLLDIKENDKVLDLCASPGGKSTYILSKLNNTGVLVSNEINSGRIKALGENLERFGSKNTIITNSDSKSLKKVFEGYFDKVVIDAPCSGQGMFRKDEFAIKDWSYEKVLECQNIQKEIIKDGYDMLKKDGILVYSTCTFSKEENEDVIEGFLNENPKAKLIEMKRLWPHKIKGEGHFACKIKKCDDKENNTKNLKLKDITKNIKDYKEFETKFLNVELEGNFELKGENLYLVPNNFPDTKDLKVLRRGLFLGTLKKNRFEPSHSLSHYLKSSDAKNIENFKLDSDYSLDYLRGNTINTSKSRGWVLVCIENIPLGWAKESNGILKNHYPKGLRIKY